MSVEEFAVTRLVARSVGYLVPTHDFVGTVHTVFAHACNVAVPGRLLTFIVGREMDGPTHIMLAGDIVPDLRRIFTRGATLRRAARRVEGTGVVVALGDARVWRPAPAVAVPAILCANLAHLQTAMPGRPRPTGAAGTAAARLVHALEQGDCAALAARTRALVGLGEGLTPSGDDFLVGLMAGLEASRDEPLHGPCLATVRREVLAALDRTTDIAAHGLRLAAAGHYAGVLERLRRALVAAPDFTEVDRALRAALAVGASSGADTVAGLLAALDVVAAGVTADIA